MGLPALDVGGDWAVANSCRMKVGSALVRAQCIGGHLDFQANGRWKFGRGALRDVVISETATCRAVFSIESRRIRALGLSATESESDIYMNYVWLSARTDFSLAVAIT